MGDSRRCIEGLATELAIIDRETAIGVDTAARRQAAQDQLEAERERLAALEGRWEKEQSLVDRLLDLRARLRGRTGEVEGTGTEPEKAADGATETLPVDDEPPTPVFRQSRKTMGNRLARSNGPNCSRRSSYCRPNSKHARVRPRSSSPA